MSNMKQLATAWLMYTQDYDGKLPESAGCNNCKVAPYVNNLQVFICPSSGLSKTMSYAQGTTESQRVYGTEYGMPMVYFPIKAALINTAGSGPREVTIMDAISEPAMTCLLAETVRPVGSLAYEVGFGKFNARDLTLAGVSGTYPGMPVLDRHFDGSNYAFMDGHVKWLKREVVEVPHDQNEAIVFYWN